MASFGEKWLESNRDGIYECGLTGARKELANSIADALEKLVDTINEATLYTIIDYDNIRHGNELIAEALSVYIAALAERSIPRTYELYQSALALT